MPYKDPQRAKERSRRYYLAHKPQIRALATEWIQRHPLQDKIARARGQRRRALRRDFGIAPKEYRAMLLDQNGRCKLCCRPRTGRRRFPVDHDHHTQAIRGLLCDNCNLGLGHFQDDPSLLRWAAFYVETNGLALETG